MPSKVYLSEEKATTAAVIIFALNYLTLLVYTKTIIHLSVGGLSVSDRL